LQVELSQVRVDRIAGLILPTATLPKFPEAGEITRVDPVPVMGTLKVPDDV